MIILERDEDILCPRCGEMEHNGECFEDDGDCSHQIGCECETCLQDHPEWDILYGNGNHYDWEHK